MVDLKNPFKNDLSLKLGGRSLTLGVQHNIDSLRCAIGGNAQGSYNWRLL